MEWIYVVPSAGWQQEQTIRLTQREPKGGEEERFISVKPRSLKKLKYAASKAALIEILKEEFTVLVYKFGHV